MVNIWTRLESVALIWSREWHSIDFLELPSFWASTDKKHTSFPFGLLGGRINWWTCWLCAAFSWSRFENSLFSWILSVFSTLIFGILMLGILIFGTLDTKQATGSGGDKTSIFIPVFSCFDVIFPQQNSTISCEFECIKLQTNMILLSGTVETSFLPEVRPSVLKMKKVFRNLQKRHLTVWVFELLKYSGA